MVVYLCRSVAVFLFQDDFNNSLYQCILFSPLFSFLTHISPQAVAVPVPVHYDGSPTGNYNPTDQFPSQQQHVEQGEGDIQRYQYSVPYPQEGECSSRDQNQQIENPQRQYENSYPDQVMEDSIKVERTSPELRGNGQHPVTSPELRGNGQHDSVPTRDPSAELRGNPLPTRDPSEDHSEEGENCKPLIEAESAAELRSET